MENKYPFPQADDFDKILLILTCPNEEDLSNTNKMQILLDGITDRQVSYYMSAAAFVGIIDNVKGKKKFTPHAKYLRGLNTYLRIAELITMVLNNKVFNTIYVYTVMFGKQEIETVADIIKRHYPDYSDAIYLRRAQTVVSWIDWIINKLNK